MAVTLKEIAARVGRSVTTVSRALAGYDDVSEATRKQIEQVARELGYEPNIAAQHLQKRRSDTIAVVVPISGPRFADPFFSELLAGIGNEAARHGFDLLVSTRSPGEEEEATYLKKIRSHRADGFLIVRTRRRDSRIEILRAHNFPFVSFGRIDGESDFPFVDVDGELGIGQAVKHLAALGHSRLACITPPTELMFTRYRLRGFKKTLERLGLPVDERLIVEGDLSQRAGHELAGQLLDSPNPPSAIVACNDLMALGAISAVQERGLTVGRDISITGFDDIPGAEHTHPPLTTVNQPVYKIGAMICQMLIRLIQGKPVEERQIILQPALVIRQSTGSAKPSPSERG